MPKLKLTSPAFNDGERIPEKYGYTEENVNPPLKIKDVPNGTQSLLLIMDDPDAKEPAGKVWDHWIVYNIEPNTSFIYEDSVPPGSKEGKNDYGRNQYGGPNPPDKEHTYMFKLYALDTTLNLKSGASKKEVQDAIEGHILEETLLTGTYAP